MIVSAEFRGGMGEQRQTKKKFTLGIKYLLVTFKRIISWFDLEEIILFFRSCIVTSSVQLNPQISNYQDLHFSNVSR